MNLKYPPELHEQDDDYTLSLKVMTIDPENTCENYRIVAHSTLAPRALRAGN